MEATVHPSLVWLQVPEPSQKEDARAAQSLLPALLSSQPLKSGATTSIRLGQPQGWPVPHPGLGRAVEGESAEPGSRHMGMAGGRFSSAETRTCSGAGVPEGATSSLRWGRCNWSVRLHHSSLPHILSHPAMASHRHSSSHGMLSPAVWLDHAIPIPPHARVAPSGTDVTAHRTCSSPDKGHGDTPALGGAGAQADTGGALGSTKPAAASSGQGAEHPSGWRPVGPGTLPCTPAPCGARPTPSTPQGRANTHGSPNLGKSEQCPDSGTVLGCATSCHHDLRWTGRRCH